MSSGDEGLKTRQEPGGKGALTEWVENSHLILLREHGGYKAGTEVSTRLSLHRRDWESEAPTSASNLSLPNIMSNNLFMLQFLNLKKKNEHTGSCLENLEEAPVRSTLPGRASKDRFRRLTLVLEERREW